MSTAYHNDTVTQLTMNTLIVELLEDLLKVAREIHGPKNSNRLLSKRLKAAEWAEGKRLTVLTFTTRLFEKLLPENDKHLCCLYPLISHVHLEHEFLTVSEQ